MKRISKYGFRIDRDAEEIAAKIKEVEGKSTTRMITAEEAIAAVESWRRKLHMVSNAAMDGVVGTFDPCAEYLPNAYRFCPMSTQFKAREVRGVLYIYDIKRSYMTGGIPVRTELTDAAKWKIISYYETKL